MTRRTVTGKCVANVNVSVVSRTVRLMGTLLRKPKIHTTALVTHDCSRTKRKYPCRLAADVSISLTFWAVWTSLDGSSNVGRPSLTGEDTPRSPGCPGVSTRRARAWVSDYRLRVTALTSVSHVQPWVRSSSFFLFNEGWQPAVGASLPPTGLE